MSWRALAREPLLHFLAIGAAIFAVAALRGDGADPDAHRIVVSRERVAQLSEGFARRWSRPPDRRELDGLVQDFVREEVMVREGMALGLDRDDTIVRRRIAQKLGFLLEDLAAPAEPDEAALAAFLAAHPERFARPARLAFEQLYFSPERRGPAAEADAERALTALRGAGGPAADGIGDPLLLPRRHAGLTLRDAAGLFGEEFAAALFAIAPGAWAGPLRSAYGLHLVRVDEREEAVQPALAEVRDAVRVAWLDEQRTRANEEALQRLRARYEVVVEETPPASVAAGGSSPAEPALR